MSDTPKLSRTNAALPLSALVLGLVVIAIVLLRQSSLNVVFMPHGFCLAWDPLLVAIFVAANGLIAFSYYSIPAALWWYVRHKKDFSFNWMLMLFAAFIVWCGTTHVMKILTLWQPLYWEESMVDLITGLISAYTAVRLWPLIPIALKIPSRDELVVLNNQLQAEILERQRAEEELNRKEALGRAVLDNAYNAFISIDPQSYIIDWNRRAERMFGWTREEALGRRLTETIIPARFQEAHLKGLERFRATGNSALANQRLELTAVNRDGDEFPVELAIFQVQTGTSSTFCAFLEDITDRKREAEALQEARDKAVELSNFKSQFLANMSHEIRTPMNGILGMAEILRSRTLNATDRSYLNTINEAGTALLAVINDILDFSKIEAGKLTIDMAEFEPIGLVESVAELLSAHARQRKLSLLTFIDPEIPYVVVGDQLRLRQILMNFGSNAIKFSENGSVIFRATLEFRDERVVRIKLSVTDQGVGMTSDEIAKLFQPFVQVESVIGRDNAGTGLGLFISKRLSELMNAEIGVHSVKNHGSTFWVSVPLRATITPMKVKAPPDLGNTRVLVVDNEEAVLEICNNYISAWGMRPTCASNAKQALEILHAAGKEDPFEFALIDLVMPEMDGLALAKTIREDEALKQTKLILITAFDKPGTGEEAISLGYDAYLTKPLRQSELLDTLAGLNKEQKIKEAALVKRKTAPQAAFQKRPELLLVVEDHPINQEVALLLLKNLGFESQVAKNGLQAIDLVQRIPYALILMDCQMPEMDGFDATRAIRKAETRTGKHVPIIAMTAHAIEGSREECIAAGMDDYISKPVNSDQLNLIFQKWLPLPAEQESSKKAPVLGSNGDAPITLQNIMTKYGSRAPEIISLFRNSAPHMLQSLKQAFTAKDMVELLRNTHALKGVFGVVSAPSLTQRCKDIESAATQENWQEVGQHVDKLEADLNSIEAALTASDG
jgi:two-component system, sensor histidine kinase and response regulator